MFNWFKRGCPEGTVHAYEWEGKLYKTAIQRASAINQAKRSAAIKCIEDIVYSRHPVWPGDTISRSEAHMIAIALLDNWNDISIKVKQAHDRR